MKTNPNDQIKEPLLKKARVQTYFETEVCSRCHGSGKYSFCQDYGDKCFKCSGTGNVLTKRGAMAQSYLVELQSVTAQSLMTGDRVACTGITLSGRSYSYIGTVIAIDCNKQDPLISSSFIGPRDRYLEITTDHVKYGKMTQGVYASSKFRAYLEHNLGLIAQALEYQSKLTKQGKLRKANG